MPPLTRTAVELSGGMAIHIYEAGKLIASPRRRRFHQRPLLSLAVQVVCALARARPTSKTHDAASQ
jgi:hypothetical protein